jgi:putative ABC transport system ATP-binding protein
MVGVTRSYDGGRIKALNGVSLRIGRGESVAVVGPSGSGKSTLLNMMTGMDRPTSGRVLFDGAEPRGPLGWTRLRAAAIGFVFQEFNLLPTLTAAENVQVPMLGVIGGAGERRRRASSLLDRVGLGHRSSHYPRDLSGGERQRVAIARCLANSPRLIVADEPTGNIDSVTSAGILRLLAEIHADDGATLVIVTHDEAIASRAQRIVRLLDGQVVSGAEGGGGACVS